MKNFNQLKLKIEELKRYLEKNTSMDVVIKFSYPVRIKFFEVEQPNLFSHVEDEPESASGALTFVLADKLGVIVENDLRIDDETLSKLKKYSKDINFLYLNAFRAFIPTLPQLKEYHEEFDSLVVKGDG